MHKEFRIEIWYPFINRLFSYPLTALIASLLLSIGFRDYIPRQVFSDYVAQLPVWLQVVLGLFALDVALFIRHWFVHMYLWRFHAVHHCAQEINWLTAERVHPVDAITMGIIDFAVLHVIGISLESMGIAMFTKTGYNYFVHSNVVLDYPKPFKYIFVSPNMHRWHHATDKKAHNANYCVIFAFIDYAMGTYYVPDNVLPEKYGAADPQLDATEKKSIWTELVHPFV